MVKYLMTAFAVVGAFALCIPRAVADSVNFENQPAGSSSFDFAGPAQTLVYSFGDGVTATFTGGVILTDETSETTDFSNVYATASFGDPTLTNPLVVTFSQPIENFQIDILNALAGTYTMSDNVGDSLTFMLATTGGSIATEGFAAAGTEVTILYDGPGSSGASFDFAIDNVTFNQPLTTAPTPEPSSITMLGLGLMGLGIAYWRKHAA